jgi:tetratricopeptide (TPR) repeat protein
LTGDYYRSTLKQAARLQKVNFRPVSLAQLALIAFKIRIMKANVCSILILILLFTTSVQAQQAAPPPALRNADSLYLNAMYKQALEKYTDYIKANPGFLPVTLARMAFCNHYMGRYDEAVKLYTDVLNRKHSPGLHAQLYSRMAMTYSMKKDKQQALTFLDSAVANGYLNAYELENSGDFKFIRNEAAFKKIYTTAYNAAYPCKSRPGARLFDFWIGEWDVFNNQYPNSRVGSSVIQDVSGGCTILENYQSSGNLYSGKSQNWYDTTTKKWTQVWIGAGGDYQTFTDGEYKDGAMRFKFQQPDANGVMQPGNFIFYNLGPNKVSQYNDLSNDGGKTFQVVYDFIYVRRQ